MTTVRLCCPRKSEFFSQCTLPENDTSRLQSVDSLRKQIRKVSDMLFGELCGPRKGSRPLEPILLGQASIFSPIHSAHMDSTGWLKRVKAFLSNMPAR